jgi:hypothetical protein
MVFIAFTNVFVQELVTIQHGHGGTCDLHCTA